VKEYSGMSAAQQMRRCGLKIDRVRLHADQDGLIAGGRADSRVPGSMYNKIE
jgi:hypothetical protein